MTIGKGEVLHSKQSVDIEVTHRIETGWAMRLKAGQSFLSTEINGKFLRKPAIYL